MRVGGSELNMRITNLRKDRLFRIGCTSAAIIVILYMIFSWNRDGSPLPSYEKVSAKEVPVLVKGNCLTLTISIS